MTEPTKKRARRDRKEEILIAATKSFSETGFRGTSLASVADAVGLTEPGLLHYFPSKIMLLQEVLEYREKQDVEKYSGVIYPKDLTLDKMLEALEGLVSDNEMKPRIIRLFTVLVGESIREDHPSHDYFVDRYVYGRRIFTEALNNICETEKINPNVDLDQIAVILMAVMDGLQIQWLLHPEEVSMSDSFNLFSEILLEYLKE